MPGHRHCSVISRKTRRHRERPAPRPWSAGPARDCGAGSGRTGQGITGWIHGWKRNGWRTADKKPVKNVELWQRLDAALKPHEVRWHWIKGHAGHAENERADELAREGVAMAKLKG